MFEVGRTYIISTVMDAESGVGTTSATVMEWEAPLLKISRLGSYEIINTSAPQFVSAIPNDAKSKEEEEAFRASRKSVYPKFIAPG